MIALPSGARRRALRTSAALALLVAPTLAQPALAQDGSPAPDTLAALVLHPRHRAVSSLELEGTPFHALAPFGELPFVLWPAESKATPFAHDPRAVERWLSRVGGALGLEQLDARFAREHSWLGDRVWEFELSHAGIPVRDAAVHVHWRGERLVGLVDRLPGRIARIEEPAATLATPELVYQLVRADGERELVLARVSVEQGPVSRTLRATSLTGELLATLVEPTVHEMAEAGSYEFREYTLSSGGTFPDQIDVDSSGKVWYSQPLDDLLAAFQPGQERFQRFQLPNADSGPDGMTIDAQDRLWTGLIYSGRLGRYDIPSGQFQEFDAPYPGAALAIPVVTRSGEVWVTDHSANRVSRFDPQGSNWAASHVLPTSDAWVTAGVEDTLAQRVYFTEFNANQLAVVAPSGPPTEIAVPGLGPAFPAVSGRQVYYSQWSAARLGVYDVETEETVEYAFPEVTEYGGPIGVLPNGDVVIGTRNLGRILVLDTEGKTFETYPIPTSLPGLKDGLTVDRSGTIWFTETGVDRLCRLEIGL